MCDYSAEAVAKRDAKVGDKLVTGWLTQHTMGLVEPANPELAVCMIAGTRTRVTLNEAMIRDFRLRAAPTTMATFQKLEIDPSKGETHRDGLVFDDQPADHRLLLDFEEGIAVEIISIPAENVGDDHSRPAAVERVRELVDA